MNLVQSLGVLGFDSRHLHQLRVAMIDETTKAYIAGLIDGEGSIMLLATHQGKWRTPTVSLSSTTRELVDLLREQYGGTIVSHKTYEDHHKPHWSWRVRYNKALLVCADLLPYLRVPAKVSRVKLLLEEYKALTPRNGKYTDDQRVAKAQFEDRFLATV